MKLTNHIVLNSQLCSRQPAHKDKNSRVKIYYFLLYFPMFTCTSVEQAKLCMYAEINVILPNKEYKIDPTGCLPAVADCYKTLFQMRNVEVNLSKAG